jgi:hypothetical protein
MAWNEGPGLDERAKFWRAFLALCVYLCADMLGTLAKRADQPAFNPCSAHHFRAERENGEHFVAQAASAQSEVGPPSHLPNASFPLVLIFRRPLEVRRL